jgi:thiamine biosynthesis lipoprotein
MHRLIGVFSRFDGTSAVSSLNAGGRLGSAPSEFSHVVSQALRYHELSRGAFDITVEPVVDLFRDNLGAERPHEPSPGEIADAMALVGSRHIDVSDGRISFKRSGMGITLDGIAKGYIVDAIASTLGRHGIGNYLVNAGGDIRTAGTGENGEPWTVAVQDPDKSGLYPDIIHLRDAAVATSGSYEIFFDRDKLFHHIINSESGRSPVVSASASVVAPSAMAADALATSVFVLDPRQGVALIDSMPGCECLIIDNDGIQSKSAGWQSATPNTGEGADP